MVNRSFYLQLILRIVLITMTALALAFLPIVLPAYYVLIPAYLLIQQTIWLIQYVNRTNEKIAFFFESVKNEDFSLKFPEDIPEQSFGELNQRMNEVNELIQEVFMANRTQEAYFKEVLAQVGVGILSYNSQGHVLFANHSVKQLLNCEQLNHIRQVESVNATLYELLSSPHPFGRRLIEVVNEREVIPLSLKSSAFTSQKETIMLLTVQDIRQELDEKETDSWLKLIRVLTHEIMNTVTPITSVTTAILDNFSIDNQLIPAEQFDDDRIKHTVKGLEVVKEQGKELMNFVQSYRSFLNVSRPNKEIVRLVDLLDTLNILLSTDLRDKHIRLDIAIEPDDLDLFIDRQQIIQVLLNLCKNAIQALDTSEHEQKIINLFAGISQDGKKWIEVRDNGPGIPPEVIDQIFVPFFTTKVSGSGIGLSLSKHILRLHGGNLRVYSIPFERTSFFLYF